MPKLCWPPKAVQWVCSVKNTKQGFRRGILISVLGLYSLSVRRDLAVTASAILWGEICGVRRWNRAVMCAGMSVTSLSPCRWQPLSSSSLRAPHRQCPASRGDHELLGVPSPGAGGVSVPVPVLPCSWGHAGSCRALQLAPRCVCEGQTNFLQLEGVGSSWSPLGDHLCSHIKDVP